MEDIIALNKSNCKNCYKCIRHCPVKSIKISGDRASIIGEECILCGQCYSACPQNAKEIRSDVKRVREMIRSGDRVYASIAPSFAASYGTGIEGMRSALLLLGFTAVEETAIGAALVKSQYEQMVDTNQHDVIISSCCHSVNLLIEKHFSSLVKHLAPVVSPMQAHAAKIKENDPDSRVVFIGPCISKKDEAAKYGGLVDAVLTFDELNLWVANQDVEIKLDCFEKDERSRERFFPTTGGILKTMKRSDSYTYYAVDGTKDCISALRDIQSGKIRNCFIEMSTCKGSCIGGPIMHEVSQLKGFQTIAEYAGRESFSAVYDNTDKLKKTFDYVSVSISLPTEQEIVEVLRKIGKTKPEHELNCGSCGYNTCREKAVAVCQNKADLTMCLPYLKEKAENFSDTIIKNTPNGIIVLNEALEIQQINRAACDLLNLKSPSYILGDQINRILMPKPFLEVVNSNTPIHDRRMYLAEYKKFVEMTILFDRDYNVIICIMRDVTKEERVKEQKENMSKQTVEIADKVVEKQMRIVQEIAMLLGETTAETKIALTKLKESITSE